MDAYDLALGQRIANIEEENRLLKEEVARLRRVFHNAVNAYPKTIIMPVPLAVWWIGLYKGMVGE